MEDWFAGREVARLEHGEVRSSLCDVVFQQRFLLHELISVSSRLADSTGRTRWLGEAAMSALRIIAQCENAILPIGFFARGSPATLRKAHLMQVTTLIGASTFRTRARATSQFAVLGLAIPRHQRLIHTCHVLTEFFLSEQKTSGSHEHSRS